MVNEQKDFKDFRWFDHPQPLQLADYQRTKEKLLAHFDKNPDVLGVYSYGGIVDDKCFPGISDIDAIVLAEKITHSQPQAFEMFNNPTPLDRYLFVHGLAFMANEQSLQYMKSYFFYPNATIKCEKGKMVPVLEPTGDVLWLAILTSALSGLPIWLSRLAKYLKYGYLPIRQVIKTLSGQRYMIANLKLCGYSNREWDKFADEISALRRDWFRLDDKVRNEQLLYLVGEGLKIYRELVDVVFRQKMSQQGFDQVLKDCPEEMILELNRNRLVLFSDRVWKKEKGPITFLNLSRFMPSRLKPAIQLTEWSVIVMPRNIAAFFYIHAGFDTVFGNYLRGRLSPSLKMPLQVGRTPLLKEFEKQAEIFDHYWQFLQGNKLRYSCSLLLNQFIDDRYSYESWYQSARYAIRMALSKMNRGLVLAKLQPMIR